MARQYSDSTPARRPVREAAYPVLAVDSGSPVVSVALATGEGRAATRRTRQPKSSGALLRLVQEVLEERGLRPADLGSLVGLRGPGSFTGLRVGLSTLLGMHEALGIPATGFSTLEALAVCTGEDGDPGPGEPDRVVAAIDALRGEWFLQAFAVTAGVAPRPLAPPACLAPEGLGAWAPCRVVGFGVHTLLEHRGLPAGCIGLEPGELASAALELLAVGEPEWNAQQLCEPLYLRAPAVRTPVRGS